MSDPAGTRLAMQAVGNAVRAACEAALRTYQRYVAAAAALESPNSDDDEYSKLAIAAFSSYSSVERWGVEEFTLFQAMRASEFTADVREWHGVDAQIYERFGCLCLGAILGLKDMGAIQSDDELELAHASAMAFMTGHANDIYRLERVRSEALKGGV
jgi:hypothetical protein